MKVKELISHLIAKDIYITTETELKYYSNDGGISFKTGVLSNPDPDLTYKIYNSRVKWFKPESNYAIYIMIEENNNNGKDSKSRDLQSDQSF